MGIPHEQLEAPVPEWIRIGGWVRTTLLDYPGHVASTLFLAGCNLRCPYCHNPELAMPPGDADRLDPAEAIAYFQTYRRLLEGVCITGGEPLLQDGLPELCARIRALGLRIKLDTNGSLPQRLHALLSHSLVDYVAVDVKAPPAKLGLVTGSGRRGEAMQREIEETVAALRSTGVDHELRTTVVPGLLDGDDLEELGAWLGGPHRFVLQQFRPGRTLDPSLRNAQAYPPQHLRDLAASLSRFFLECTVRGIG